MNKTVLIFLVWLLLVVTIREPPVLRSVKDKYKLLRQELIRTGRFKCIHHKVIITGMNKKGSNGDVGYNVNKGYEIFLCLKGDENAVMHVLLHELSHITVTEYDHSSKFWNNLKEIKEIAKKIGIYQTISSQKFCDGIISD
jgi:hypothetical protein